MHSSIKDILVSGLGLEDNSQVEVNFHIDTDEDNTPDTNDLTVSENPSAEVEDAGEEVSGAADEMEQLEEAQDSLESISLIMDRHIANNTMSEMGLAMYKIALESIVPADIIDTVGRVSLESAYGISKQHASYLTKIELEEISKKVSEISMESKLDFLNKAQHAIDVFIRQEAALLKRANALMTLAKSSSNEHASNDTLTVNGGKKSPNMRHITTLTWNTEQEFVKHVKHFSDLYNSMSSLKSGYSDDFTDRIFPGSRSWPKNADGKAHYEMFRIRLIRDKNLVRGHLQPKVTTERKLPNLTPSTCEAVLHELIETLTHGKVMKANLKEMSGVLKTVAKREVNTQIKHTGGPNGGPSIGFDVKTTYPPGYEDMYKTLIELKKIRIKVNSDILNYVNYCLTDREFV